MTSAGFDALRRYGEATALYDARGAVSYLDLAARCEAFAEALGAERQLVLLKAGNDLDSVVSYLACRGAGHVVILTGPEDGGLDHRIVRAFSPTVICERGRIQKVSDTSRPPLHPDLAMLLPTSGTTGSPQLVRLSAANLDSNAAAIAEYLEITSQDRAITSLPIHYSYGLSVLNSHLAAGAGVILSDLSVTHPRFWELFRRHGATTMAGVPYTYELLERMGLRENPPATLHTLTQAGGALPRDLVTTYADFAARAGLRFFVMYGQTEAAPRMAYLPPELAAQHPDCIGRAIPGGAFRLVDEDGNEVRRAGATGELVYRGPNVMMGYARTREHLAADAELAELRTGDLACRTEEGLYRIVGRASRFVKVAGLRVGLDDLEALLAESGRKAFVAGTDGGVAICCVGSEEADTVRAYVVSRCGIPAARVIAYAVPEEPRLPSGKVDYPSIRREGEARAADAARALDAGGVIAAAYARALGIELPPGNATFVSLGGDSLAYVTASIAIEEALGQIPEGWEQIPIENLEAMAIGPRPATRVLRAVSTELVVRVAALSLVIAAHADGPPTLQGGANVLFALSGFSLARFQGQALLKGSVRPALGSALYRMVLPCLLLAGLALPMSTIKAPLDWLLLINTFTGRWTVPLNTYWFIETLFHSLLIVSALALAPPLRRFAAGRPFASALTLVAAATALMLVVPHFWSDRRTDFHFSVDAWFYVYCLGWAAYVARTGWQKALVVALAAAITTLQYGASTGREIWLTLGLAIVLFAPSIKLPRPAAWAVTHLAAANFFIYLTHPIARAAFFRWGYKLHTPFLKFAGLWVVSVAIGLVFSWAWTTFAHRLWSMLRDFATGLRPLRPRRA